MDAILKKIQITPVKRNKNDEITGPATALITVEVPLDGEIQQQEVSSLLDILTKEWIKVTITANQLTFRPDYTNQATVNQSDITSNDIVNVDNNLIQNSLN